MKSALKFSHVFCSPGLLLQSLQLLLKMPVLKTRLYATEIMCFGDWGVDLDSD